MTKAEFSEKINNLQAKFVPKMLQLVEEGQRDLLQVVTEANDSGIDPLFVFDKVQAYFAKIDQTLQKLGESNV